MKEIRVAAGLQIEDRAGDASAAPKLVGYAAVFNSATNIGGMFREMIKPGAFSDALKRSDVHALFNHDENMVIGRAKAGTLQMEEDAHGLKVTITPPDTQDARDLMVSMKRGDIDQMSFAFTMQGGVQAWDESADPPLRTIQRVGELYDVSVVTRGAYPTTEVAVRSLDDYRKTRNSDHAHRRVKRKISLDEMSRR